MEREQPGDCSGLVSIIFPPFLPHAPGYIWPRAVFRLFTGFMPAHTALKSLAKLFLESDLQSILKEILIISTSELCLIYFFKVSLQDSFPQMLLTDPFSHCLPWAHYRQHMVDISVMSISAWVCKTCFRKVGQTGCLFLAPSNYRRKKDTL